jgi:hypothetical protein
VQFFLDRGADLNNRKGRKWSGRTYHHSILTAAATGGSPQVLSLVLQREAHMTDTDWQHGMFQAARKGHVGMMQLLNENKPHAAVPAQQGGVRK